MVVWLEHVHHVLRKVRCSFTRAIFRATFAAISWRCSFLYAAATSYKDCGKAAIDFNVVQNRKKSATASKQTKKNVGGKVLNVLRLWIVQCWDISFWFPPLSLGSCKLHAKALPTRRKYVEGRS